MNKECTCYKKYFSVRTNSFFDNTTIDLRQLIIVAWKWANDVSQIQIFQETTIIHSCFYKFVKKLQTNCERWFLRILFFSVVRDCMSGRRKLIQIQT
jgi:hypothetical protein